MGEGVFQGPTKPNDGPSEAFPNANDGYGPGDAMSDAVQGIQHSGAPPAGGNEQQNVGVQTRPVATTPHTVGQPSTDGSTLASTPGSNPTGVNVSTPDASELSDPAARTGSALPKPGSGVRTRDH